MKDSTADAVRDYWDAYAANLSVPGESWGSPSFFSAIKLDHDRMYGGANRILDLETIAGKRLLELACGIGLDTVEFAAHGADVTAIDFSPTCLDLARRSLEQRGLGATVEHANAEALPYDSESFDIVVARGLLMFTVDDGKVVSELRRVLKPGGRANILVHNRYSWYVWFAAVSGTNRVHESGEPPIDRLYTRAQVRRMLDGFSSVEITFDRYPTEAKRSGISAQLFNRLVVPAARWLPRPVMGPLGYYLIVDAIK